MKKLIFHQKTAKNLRNYHYAIFQDECPDEVQNNKVSAKTIFFYFNFSLQAIKLKTLKMFCSKTIEILNKIPIISPDNKLKFFWDFVIMLTILLHFFFLVFDLTFENPSFHLFYQNWLQIMIFLLPIDVFLKINCGFFEAGAPIKDRKIIIRKYQKTDLPYDLINFLTLMINVQFETFILNLRWAHLIQLLYFVKLPIFQNLIENFEEIINFDEKVEAFVSILKLFTKMLFFAHLTACLWYYIGSSGFNIESNWLEAKTLNDKDIFFKYLVSLYWAITTISTTGYGDITAQNEAEFVFCLFVMIMGSIFFGYSLTYMGVVFDKLQKEQTIKK